MDPYGNLYLDEDASEEDKQRADDWGKEIEADEFRRKLKEIETRELETRT